MIQLVALIWLIMQLAPAATWTSEPARAHAASSLCTLLPGKTIALVRVEQDTTLPHGPTGAEPMTATGVRPGPYDSLLATPTTPMPAARVRVLQLDSATRATIAASGVAHDLIFLRAAPYRADCRTIRWLDTIPFVVRGEVGYVRGSLAPREQWIAGVPLVIIPDAWNYPYPRRRGLAIRVSAGTPLAPAEAMFALNAALELPRPTTREMRLQQDSVKRGSALAWARANTAAAELEPARTIVRRAVLDPDWEVASRFPSRLRGSYRVELDVDGERSTWFFRTYERPGYSWPGPPAQQTIAALLVSPHVFGYRLVGLTADTRDSLAKLDPVARGRLPLTWLVVNDRTTVASNDARRSFTGFLEFPLSTAPQVLWNDLDAFVPPQNPVDSAMLARLKRSIERKDRQPQLPLAVRLDANGKVHADTVLNVGAKKVRVRLERLDTVSLRRTTRASDE